MHVDYDNKRLMINCPKAYHTSLMLDHVLDIISTEHEALTGDECCVEGSYVYSFIGVEVYRYAEPSAHRYPSFKNYMLTGMPLSMFTGEFMPEETTIELTESIDEQSDRATLHIEVEGDVSTQALDDAAIAVQNAKL
jgi:hypothetical protein